MRPVLDTVTPATDVSTCLSIVPFETMQLVREPYQSAIVRSKRERLLAGGRKPATVMLIDDRSCLEDSMINDEAYPGIRKEADILG
jgi:hypothetical protein